MRRSRFSEEQIIGILKEQDAGQKTADVCRRHVRVRLRELSRQRRRFGYLRDVLERMVNGYPASRLADLLPWNWKPAVNA